MGNEEIGKEEMKACLPVKQSWSTCFLVA